MNAPQYNKVWKNLRMGSRPVPGSRVTSHQIRDTLHFCLRYPSRDTLYAIRYTSLLSTTTHRKMYPLWGRRTPLIPDLLIPYNEREKYVWCPQIRQTVGALCPLNVLLDVNLVAYFSDVASAMKTASSTPVLSLTSFKVNSQIISPAALCRAI